MGGTPKALRPNTSTHSSLEHLKPWLPDPVESLDSKPQLSPKWRWKPDRHGKPNCNSERLAEGKLKKDPFGGYLGISGRITLICDKFGA